MALFQWQDVPTISNILIISNLLKGNLFVNLGLNGQTMIDN
jgi:hypothetical protein